MADNDRALYVGVNIGASTPMVLARAQDAVTNVGFEVVPVAARANLDIENVGFSEMGVLGRAQYAALAVHDFADLNDGIEILLISTDIKTVERNLAGK
jgi:hypothetical protein